MKIKTYLPLFSGFYNTIWQSDDKEQMEVSYINEQRSAKGLEPINWDDCQFEYNDYQMDVVKGIAQYLERELKTFVSDITVERIVSPKEYNFRNDSANVVITLSMDNVKAIKKYLIDNSEQFAGYLKDTYTSCSGFISSYPNNIEEFMTNKPLKDSHKLGSILQFICNNEGIEEINAYYNVEANLSVANYDKLV